MQDGLFSLSTAFLTFRSLAIFRTSSAPFLNSPVTSLPFASITCSICISALGRGVGSPPSCSGQTGIRHLFEYCLIISLLRAFVPLYLEFIPRRQALMRMGLWILDLRFWISDFFLPLIPVFCIFCYLLTLCYFKISTFGFSNTPSI